MFLRAEIAFDILRYMTPIIDRGLLVFFAGLLAGYLEMSGLADPTQHTQNVDALTNLIGGMITIVTVISYFVHVTAIEKHKIEFGVTPKKYPVQGILTAIHDFAIKKTVVTEPTNPLE